ncbi:hypothetical protein ACQB60_10665 [Actinomycetota bacterium Odt1-20B]
MEDVEDVEDVEDMESKHLGLAGASAGVGVAVFLRTVEAPVWSFALAGVVIIACVYGGSRLDSKAVGRRRPRA